LKKVISIVLLFTFFFNVAGYYFGYLVLRYRAGLQLTHYLDEGDYSSEALTLKIPLTVPYYSDSQDYERVDGAFEHNGEFFKLVKQKLERDTLYIVCIKDSPGKRLFTIMTDFANLSTDLPASQKTLKLVGSLIKEYVSTLPVQSHEQTGWSLAFNFVPQRFELLENVLRIFSPPPDGQV